MSIDLGQIQKSGRSKKTSYQNERAFRLSGFFSKKKLSDKKKVQLYKDLTTLLKAGIDFKTALTIVWDQQKKEVDRELLNSILSNVVKGKSFFEALELTQRFSPYEVFSIKIGEETHKLDTILEELQKFFQRKVKLKKQVTSILIYPVFILALTFATLYFMLTFVVPLFQSVFNQFNRELPALTRFVISLSKNFSNIFLGGLLAIVILFLLYRRIRRTTYFKVMSSKILLRIPFFGKLIKEIYITRFCQTMALLLVSRTSLVESLGLIRHMIGFHPLKKALEIMENDVTRGITLGDSMQKSKIFDTNLISMVKIAEQVNQLDAMFVNLSEQYDEEVEHKTKVMGAVIEPMLILFIGGIVGVIMVSMYAPMFDLSKVIGGN